MAEQFENANIEVAYFDGIQVTATDPQRIAEKEGLRLSRFARHLRPGEFGCYFSHRHLWQSLVASEAEAYGSMRLTEIDS
jgi:GR25 family glycosyltransferase involved in LPS biosynthesis